MFSFVVGGVARGYMGGGAGYVLSREAVRRLVTGSRCSQPSRLSSNDSANTTDNRKSSKTSLPCLRVDPIGDEDVEMGRCMEQCGVEMGVSTDSDGFERFLSAPLYLSVDRNREALNGAPAKAGNDSWQPGWRGACGNKATRCISDYAISFHPVPEKLMGVFEYFVYQLIY